MDALEALDFDREFPELFPVAARGERVPEFPGRGAGSNAMRPVASRPRGGGSRGAALAAAAGAGRLGVEPRSPLVSALLDEGEAVPALSAAEESGASGGGAARGEEAVGGTPAHAELASAEAPPEETESEAVRQAGDGDERAPSAEVVVMASSLRGRPRDARKGKAGSKAAGSTPAPAATPAAHGAPAPVTERGAPVRSETRRPLRLVGVAAALVLAAALILALLQLRP